MVKTIKVESVSSKIAFHPDLVLHPIDLNTLVVAPEVFNFYSQKLKPYGLSVVKGRNRLGRNYPEDIKYNIFRIGKHFVHKKGFSDDIINEYYNKLGINLINVTQGYTKCSIALVNNQSAITSDKKIAEKLTDAGYDILLIEKGWIQLPGYDYGFIGGASGHISPKEMVLTGSLLNHPDKAAIEAFIESKEIEIIYLSEDIIIDLGTVLLFSI